MNASDLSGTAWRKSSRSGSNEGSCVEVAAWRKSSHSGSNEGTCVEVAGNLPGVVAVRDSKNPAGPSLAFSAAEWSTFVTAIKHGTLD